MRVQRGINFQILVSTSRYAQHFNEMLNQTDNVHVGPSHGLLFVL
jgi:hypothetical protein